MYWCFRAAIAAIALLSAAANGQSTIPLTLAEAEDKALEAEPGAESLRAGASALRDRAVLAGELPDPVLRVGMNNFPLESGGFSTEGMTHAAVGIRQMFSAAQKRELGARQLRQYADAREQQGAARQRDVLMLLRHSWLDVYLHEQKLGLLRESRPFFRDLVQVSRSLYEVGRKGQQDILRAELELSRLDDRLIDGERMLAQSRAALGEWIGANAARPIAAKLPAWQAAPPLIDLLAGLDQHPLLQAADAELTARRTGVDLAEQRSKPGWALDVGYGYRQGRLPGGEPRSDLVTVGVSIDLPFLRKRSVDSSLSAALQDESAAKAGRLKLLRQVRAGLESEYAHFSELRRRIALYEERILTQANEHAAASLRAYQNDRADFADVMRGYIDDLDARSRYLELQVEYARSYAVLANLGGLPR